MLIKGNFTDQNIHSERNVFMGLKQYSNALFFLWQILRTDKITMTERYLLVFAKPVFSKCAGSVGCKKHMNKMQWK